MEAIAVADVAAPGGGRPGDGPVIRAPPLLRAHRTAGGGRHRGAVADLAAGRGAFAAPVGRRRRDGRGAQLLRPPGRPGRHRAARHPADVRPADRRRRPRLAAHRPGPALPRGVRARSGADPAITAHAGPRLPRLDRTETASGRGASGRSARPLPRARLARPPQKRPRPHHHRPRPREPACPRTGGPRPPASPRPRPANHQDNGWLCTAGCTQPSIIPAQRAPDPDNSKKRHPASSFREKPGRDISAEPEISLPGVRTTGPG